MEKINPYVRLAMRDVIDKKWIVSRSIWDYEIIYIAEGEMNVLTNGVNYTAEAGDIVFLRPYKSHILTSKCDVTSQPHVHFDLFKDGLSETIPVSLKRRSKMSEEERTFFRTDNLKALGFDFPPVMRLHNHLAIKDLLYKIIDEYHMKLSDYETYLSALMCQLLIVIRRSYEISKLDIRQEHLTAFENVQRYVLDNIDRNITVDELAKFTYLSKFHFIRVFTGHFGDTPHRYITKLRVERAKELLLYDDSLSISEIAVRLNFDSQQTFSYWFKKNVGVSPINYKTKRGR